MVASHDGRLTSKTASCEIDITLEDNGKTGI